MSLIEVGEPTGRAPDNTAERDPFHRDSARISPPNSKDRTTHRYDCVLWHRAEPCISRGRQQLRDLRALRVRPRRRGWCARGAVVRGVGATRRQRGRLAPRVGVVPPTRALSRPDASRARLPRRPREQRASARVASAGPSQSHSHTPRVAARSDLGRDRGRLVGGDQRHGPPARLSSTRRARSTTRTTLLLGVCFPGRSERRRQYIYIYIYIIYTYIIIYIYVCVRARLCVCVCLDARAARARRARRARV